jgi:hypothetical protein
VRRLPQAWYEQQDRTLSAPVEDLQAHSAGYDDEPFAVRGFIGKALTWRRRLRSYTGRERENGGSDEDDERLVHGFLGSTPGL